MDLRSPSEFASVSLRVGACQLLAAGVLLPACVGAVSEPSLQCVPPEIVVVHDFGSARLLAIDTTYAPTDDSIVGGEAGFVAMTEPVASNSWRRVDPIPDGPDVRDVAVISPLPGPPDAYARALVLYTDDRLMTTSDAGTSWVEADSAAALLAVTFWDESRAIGVGTEGVSVSGDAGATWNPLGGSATVNLVDVVGSESDGGVVAVGPSCSILFSEDGSTFEAADISCDFDLTTVARGEYKSEDFWWAAAPTGEIMRSADGLEWELYTRFEGSLTGMTASIFGGAQVVVSDGELLHALQGREWKSWDPSVNLAAFENHSFVGVGGGVVAEIYLCPALVSEGK